jgi:hypothetical protein
LIIVLAITREITYNFHTSLQAGTDAYKTYRSGSTGGAYNAKVIDIDELVDQFAFGIKKDPIICKEFFKVARINLLLPKICFPHWQSVTYNEYREHETSVFADQLNLVPTFGWPASDVC